jgi:hypothetical protein
MCDGTGLTGPGRQGHWSREHCRAIEQTSLACSDLGFWACQIAIPARYGRGGHFLGRGAGGTCVGYITPADEVGPGGWVPQQHQLNLMARQSLWYDDDLESVRRLYSLCHSGDAEQKRGTTPVVNFCARGLRVVSRTAEHVEGCGKGMPDWIIKPSAH